MVDSIVSRVREKFHRSIELRGHLLEMTSSRDNVPRALKIRRSYK